MGLDTSHDCWHGPYSQFHRWRKWLALQCGIPFELCKDIAGGFVFTEDDEPALQRLLPFGGDPINARLRKLATGFNCQIDLGAFSHDPIGYLLCHSDCSGRIRWWHARLLALRLTQILRQVKRDEDEALAFANIRRAENGLEPYADATPLRRGIYDGHWNATKRFALGCWRAWRERKDVRFG